MKNNIDTNRSFLYGDGFFDTLLLEKGLCKSYELHFARNVKSAQILEMNWQNEWTKEYFEYLLNEIYLKYNEKSLKVRFTFFRDSHGGYSPECNKMSFIIKTESFIQKINTALKTMIYRKASKQCNFFSGIKLTSSILYVVAALEMKKQNCDEIIILNEFGRVCESLNSNIYIEKNGIFYTPPLSEGCVDGTFRTLMLNGDLGYNVIEKPIDIDEIKDGKIYFSNAVKGLTKGLLV